MEEQGEEILLESRYRIEGRDFNRAGEVSIDIKVRLKEIGFDPALVRRVAIAAFEAEMNVVLHAWRGEALLAVSPSRISLEFADEGPGIPDIDLAMREGFSTASPEARRLGYGAGMGLPTMKRNADRLRIDSEVGAGTRARLLFIVRT